MPFSRRRVLKGLAALGVAAAAPAASAAPRTPAPKQPGIELAVATICFDGFANRKHEPAFRLLPELGIRNVEFNVWYPDVITPNYLATLKTRCSAAGLRPVCLQGSGFGGEGPGGVQKDVGHKLALMYGARDLGCRLIKCTGARRGTEGSLRSVIEVCRELAPAAEELDLTVLLENHANNVLESIADYEEIFAAIDSPRIAMCCDLAHFWGAGIDPLDVITRFHSRIRHVDLKDNRSKGGGHSVVPYGEGIMDFDGICDALVERNYQGFFLLEMAWREPREPVVANLKKGRDLFQRYVRS